jgi:protein-disulfide isomerase
MTSLRHIVFAVCAAPLALALAACGDSKEESGLPTGDPIAPIAAPAGQSWTQVAAVTPEGGYVIGNPDAPLKLVEYASHTCSHCAEFAQTGAAPLDGYVEKGIVSYEIRNQIHDPIDLTFALLARCGDAAAFHPLANQGWQNFEAVVQGIQSAGPELEQAMQAPEGKRFQAIAQAAGLLDFFAARGISRDQAMQCLADTKKAQEIVTNSQTQSDELGVTGTPTFFLNGKLVEGTRWIDIEPALQAAGAR